MAAKKGNTAAKAEKIAEPIVSDFGLKLWDVRFEKEGTDWFLRVFIDKPGGVGIDDCEKVSRAIDKPLDDADFIEQAYIMEVSSPGLERELLRDNHFEEYIGADVMVRMIRPLDGLGKEFRGILEAYSDGIATIKDHDEKRSIEVNKKETVWIKLDDF